MKRIIAVCLLLFSLIGFEMPRKAEIPDGAFAVWQAPSIGTSTPVYWSEGTGQDKVDAEQSAVIRWYGKGYFIGDHADSVVDGGHWNVNQMTVGSMGYLITPTETRQYRCDLVALAQLDGWSYFIDGHVVRLHSDQILCACCAEKENENYIAIFKYVGVMP